MVGPRNLQSFLEAVERVETGLEKVIIARKALDIKCHLTFSTYF